MTNTLTALSEKNQKRLEISYNMFCEHFKVPFCDLSDCEYSQTKEVCIYYYSLIMSEDCNNEKLSYLFRYMQICFDYIIHEKSLSEENRCLRLTELACILPESMRMLFWGWLLSNKVTALEKYYKQGIFILGETSSSLLRDVINYICTREHPKKRQIFIDIDNIVLQEYPNEQFCDTYNRLSNK